MSYCVFINILHYDGGFVNRINNFSKKGKHKFISDVYGATGLFKTGENPTASDVGKVGNDVL